MSPPLHYGDAPRGPLGAIVRPQTPRLSGDATLIPLFCSVRRDKST
jgi:hypothetical protein